jgi:hypothetical protein
MASHSFQRKYEEIKEKTNTQPGIWMSIILVYRTSSQLFLQIANSPKSHHFYDGVYYLGQLSKKKKKTGETKDSMAYTHPHRTCFPRVQIQTA